jgi:hypothetical protein
MDEDFAVSRPLVRPGLPHIRFLFVRSRLRSTLPSDPASRRRPCASLALHLHQVVQGTCTPRLSNMLGTRPGGLPPEALRSAPSRRLRLPPMWRPRRPQHPPPPGRLPGRRSPLQGLPPGLQHVHQHPLARDPSEPRPDPPDQPRRRQGGAHRDARPRGRDQPPASAPVAPCDPGSRLGRCRSRAAAG